MKPLLAHFPVSIEEYNSAIDENGLIWFTR